MYIHTVFAVKRSENRNPVTFCGRNKFFERFSLSFRLPNGYSVEFVAQNKPAFVLFFDVLVCGIIEFSVYHTFPIAFIVIHFYLGFAIICYLATIISFLKSVVNVLMFEKKRKSF